MTLFNQAGSVAETYRYSVFGQPNTPSALGNPFLFTGREYDSETGLYHYRARAYDPILRRFLQPDPLGFADNMNLYAYVGNGPVNAVDPWGLFTFGDAFVNLKRKGVTPAVDGGWYSEAQLFAEWYLLELELLNEYNWPSELRKENRACPKTIEVQDGRGINPDPNFWNDPGAANWEHKPAVFEMRSLPIAGGHANQCCYDAEGNIMTEIPAAGSADYFAFDWFFPFGHAGHDWLTWGAAQRLHREEDYFRVRPRIIE